jgi:cation diffusion facilitator family transporter
LYLAAKPRDKNHPYGHGKVEFLAAGIEGTLLFAAGLLTLHKSVQDYLNASEIDITGIPLILVIALGIGNYLLGVYSEKKGLDSNSPALISSGLHLKSDGYTSLAIFISLVIIYFTKLYWIDTLAAVIAGIYIIYMGYSVMRQALLNILDTADESILEKIIDFIQTNRDKHWIDMHNFRILKFGSEYHVDAHLTLPFFYTNREIHREMVEVHELINTHFKSTVEIFIHPDPCEPFCCHYCANDECLERSEPFKSEIKWTLENVLANEKHGAQIIL